MLDYDELERLVTPGTRAVVVTHASNVTGNAVDIARVAALAHAAGALVIVDASQSAGTAHIDMRAMGLDVVCFTGHKGLMGPQHRWPGRGGGRRRGALGHGRHGCAQLRYVAAHGVAHAP